MLRRVHLAISVVALLLLPATASAGDHHTKDHAGWNDPNIVCCSKEGHWMRVDAENKGNPPKPFDDKWQKDDTSIIILISALRERRLPDTLHDMLIHAKFPERVVAGVVQQNAKADLDAVVGACEKFETPVKMDPHTFVLTPLKTDGPECTIAKQIRMLRLDVSEAAGPVYARARGSELVEDEDFCMQIDAHTVFKQDWDVLMLEQWGAADNEFAVLSTYPTNYKDLYKNSNNHWEMPHLCSAVISHGGGAVHNNQAKAAANLQRPLLAPLWAAGLSFSRCHAEKNVPNDVHLRHIFTGEEYARGARLWTHGYDFYSITRPIIGVYYGNEKGGKGGWHTDHEQFILSQKRMATLLQAPKSDQSPEAIAALGTYGIGTKRTLQQYYQFSGVDVTTGIATENCMVKYVPWWHGDPPRPEPIVSEAVAIVPNAVHVPPAKGGLLLRGGDIARANGFGNHAPGNQLAGGTSALKEHQMLVCGVVVVLFAFVAVLMMRVKWIGVMCKRYNKAQSRQM